MVGIFQKYTVSRLIELSLLVLCLFLGTFLFWLIKKAPLDDAYIYIRYAEQFAGGNGLVFNVGERVEGYSSFTWMVLLLFNTVLGFAPDLFLQYAALFFHLSTILLIWLFTKHFFKECPRYLPTILYATLPAGALWAGLGLETALFTFMILFSLYCYLRYTADSYQKVFVGLLFCLTALTRPEGILLYAAFLVFEVGWSSVTSKKFCLKSVYPYALPLLLFLFFLLARHHYYDEWFPNTVYVKVGSGLRVWSRGFTYLTGALNYFLGAITLFLFVFLYGLVIRRDKAWWTTSWIALSMCVLAIMSGGNNWPYFRYALPLAPLLLILFSEFISAGLKVSKNFTGAWRIPVRVMLLFVLFLVPYRHQRDSWQPLSMVSFVSGNELFRAYAQFHALLLTEALVDKHDAIALNPMPFTSSFFKGPVIDMLGLVDKYIAHRNLPMGIRTHSHEKGDGRYIMCRKPAIIKFFGDLGLTVKPQSQGTTQKLYFISDKEIAESAIFKRHYEPWHPKTINPPLSVNFYRLKSTKMRDIAPEKVQTLYESAIVPILSRTPDIRASIVNSFRKVWPELRIRVNLNWIDETIRLLSFEKNV